MKSNLHKDITVITILFNTPKKKIYNLRQYKNFNLIIFEQGSPISSKNELKNVLGFKFNYYYSQSNLGLSKGINFLIKKTKTKYCLVTEPDIFIKEKSVINLKKAIETDKKLLLLGPRYNKKKAKKNLKYTNKIDLSCVFFQTKKIKKFNFYDEDFFFFWTDVDLVKRINNSSFKMAVAQNSLASHLMSSSSNDKFYVNLLREKSYKYGEFIYDYKYGKLRLLKITRQLFQSIIKIFFYLLIFNKKNFSINFGYLLGIINFLFYFLKKIIFKVLF